MYENFYQLRAKPFRLSPDPGFFFASRGHKRALAYLRYGLSQAEGFVVITGAPGTGKTTLAQILLQEMDQSDVVVAHLTTTQLEADEMLRMVMASFGLRYEGQDKAGLLKTLEAFFMARSRERKRVLLVVDEAQNLPARSLEELRMLSNLQVGEQALLQTFLLGQVQFRQMLDHPDLEQLRQRVIANYHLSALGEDECQNYVESRLAHVGWNDDPHFTDEAFEIIYRYTEGVPRRINMLCDRVLLFSGLEERHTIDADVLHDVTDELQSEISGRPIARPAKTNTEVLPDVVSTGTKDATKETHQSVNSVPETDFADSVPEQDTKTKTDKPDVSPPREPATVSPDESHAVAVSFPESGVMMDRVVPDDGWMQHVAQAQPDNIETDDSNNNEPAEMERFRVITGGREAAIDIVDTSETVVIEPPPSSVDSPLPDVVVPLPDAMASLPDAPGDTREVVLRKILRLVLAFHRSPRSFPGLDDPTQPLPKGIKDILELAIAEDHVLSGLRQIAVMGISPAMLRAAVRFFVRRVLFLPGGDDFRVFGLAAGASLTEVETHYDLLMKLLRQDRKANDESGVSRVGAAYERLCRSEITSPSRPEELAKDPGDIEDVEEELDLDLSPPMGHGVSSGLRPPPVNAGEMVASDTRTAPTARNVILIVGVVVIVYLTQIKITGDAAPEPGVDLPDAPVVATVPAVEPVTASVVAPVNKTTSEDVVVSEIAQAALASKVAGEEAARVAAQADALAKAVAAAKAEEAAKKAEAEAQAVELRAAAVAKRQREAEVRAQADARARAKAAAEAKVVAKAKAEAQAAAEAKARAQAKVKAAAEAKAMAEAKAQATAQAEASAGLISSASLDKMLTVFTAAYQAGDLDKLLSLYSPVVRTDKFIDIAGVRGEYQTLFKNSTGRSVQFKNMSWEQKAGYARGSGQYTISVKGRDGQPAYEESGDVTLQVESHSGELQIIRYYTSGTVLTEHAKTQPATGGIDADKANAGTSSFGRISEKELNALLSTLVNTYAAGDITAFMQLFAKDAQTSDRATVKGIREDYVGLFNSTSFRTIAFKEMQWTWDGDIARGEGIYNVEVQANGQNKRDHYQGPLWVQIERREGAIRITHFAFSEYKG
ncbi:MAG: AAA family ATPase [Gammaproteobacteria bacterium]|nr:AAA family ATPase [Gammaproteobacteria bacterium]